MAQIRIFNLNEETHRELKAQAAKLGLTLNEYLKQILDEAKKRKEVKK